MKNCINCENVIDAEFHYCPTCGQRTALHRLSFHDITHDGLHYVTHADKGVFYLVLNLAKYPGKVAREYVEGKRKKYFPPLNFFLLVAGIFVFSLSFLQSFKPGVTSAALDQRIETMKANPAFAQQLKNVPGLEAKLKTVFIRQDNAERFIAKYTNFIAMIATPLISLVCFLFYYKGRYTYIEHLVTNLYLAGFTSLVYALVVAPAKSLMSYDPTWLLVSYFLFEIFYRAFAYYQFFQGQSKAAMFKSIGIQTVAILLWAGISFYMVFTYIRSGFWGLLQ